MDVTQTGWPLGVRVKRACGTCGTAVVLVCRELQQRVCHDCGDLHTDAVFVGACQRCERMMEERASVLEP